MMPKQDLLPFLTNAAGNSYRVSNGVVNDTSTPTPLPHSPDGWQDTEISWERNTKYFGVFRSFTTPLKYVREGLRIIRNRLYRFGPEDKIYQVINWLDKSFGGGWVHRSFYKGELDLSQMDDNDDDHVITVPIMEGDLVKLFKAYETQTYEIPITGPNVFMDGLKLQEKINYTVLDLDIGQTFHTIGVISTNQEGPGAGVLVGQSPLQDLVGFSNVADDEDRWIEKSVDQTFTNVVEGTLSFEIPTGVPLGTSYEAHFAKSDGSVYPIVPLAVFAAGVHTYSINLNIPMLPGEKVFIFGQYAAPGFGGRIKYLQTDFSFSYYSKFRTTFTKTLRPLELGQALLDKMTGGGYTFSSNYLSTVWENLTVTSGDGLRGIPGAVIKTSWADYFDSYNVPTNLEMSFQGKTLSVEPKATAFDQTVSLPLGKVRGFKRSFSKDNMFNSVSIGYPTSDTTTYESLNGRGAFNAISEYTSSVTRNPKKLELVSKYKASIGEIELIRINLEGKTTTDSSTDNDVYFLHIEKTPVNDGSANAPFYKLYRAPYDSITGLISPAEAFNIELSPARCLRRHGNYLRSVFYWMAATKLVFQTSDKNTEMATVKNGVTIQENADIVIGTLDAPLFIPLLLTLTSPIDRMITTVMKNNPNQSFSFEADGNTHYGFPMSVKLKPANRPVQESVLMCSPLTDITKFID